MYTWNTKASNNDFQLAGISKHENFSATGK